MNVITEQEAIVVAVVDDIINGIEDETILILADWCEDNGEYDLAEFLRDAEPFRIVETTETVEWIGEDYEVSYEVSYEDNSASWYDAYRRYRHSHFQSILGGKVGVYIGEGQNYQTGNYESSYALIEAKDQRSLPLLVADILQQLFN